MGLQLVKSRMLVEGSPFHYWIAVDYGYLFPSFLRPREIWMYPACWRSSCWRGCHSGLISWRYFFLGNQLRLCGFCCSCGSCCLGGRLIFFQGDVVHSSHLGLVWGGVGQGVRWGQVAIYQAKAAQFLCTPTCPPPLQTLAFFNLATYSNCWNSLLQYSLCGLLASSQASSLKTSNQEKNQRNAATNQPI